MGNVPLMFLSEEQVIELHSVLIRNYGGMPGLRDVGLLQAAVMTPRATFSGEYLHEDVPSMAAAYLFHLAKNHAFYDGNKRIELAAAIAFLHANGYSLNVQEDEAADATLAVAAGAWSKEEITVWFQKAACRT